MTKGYITNDKEQMIKDKEQMTEGKRERVEPRDDNISLLHTLFKGCHYTGENM